MKRRQVDADPERAISAAAAFACEWAFEERCRCRCKGKLHGAKRVNSVEQLVELPAADPHFAEVEEKTDLGPMRKVVARITKPYGWRGKKHTLVLTLECGHQVYRKAAKGTIKREDEDTGRIRRRKGLKRVHCSKCRVADPSLATGTLSVVRQLSGGAGSSHKSKSTSVDRSQKPRGGELTPVKLRGSNPRFYLQWAFSTTSIEGHYQGWNVIDAVRNRTLWFLEPDEAKARKRLAEVTKTTLAAERELRTAGVLRRGSPAKNARAR